MEQNLFNQNQPQSKEVSIFNFENQNFRTVIIDEQIWFVASDVTKILGYQNGRKAIDDHCTKGVTKKYTLLTNGGNQELTIINESGIYQLVMTSKMPNAIKFKDWVTSQVLPSIRKTGSYSIKHPEFKIPQTYAEALRLAADQAERIEEQAKKIEQDKPKVEFADKVLDSKNSISIGEFSKLIGWGQNKLFLWLRDNKYLMANNIPYQKYIESGYFKVIEYLIDKKKESKIKTLITGKGQIYFTDKLK
jgi:anti-repressor protein